MSVETSSVLPAAQTTATAPRLTRDTGFLAMLTTQFLGAFNDNLFKQMVLLLCADLLAAGGPKRESWAQALFAIPFVLFSGFAGWLSDRTPKRTIIVSMKAAEALIMLAGMSAFLIGGNDLGRQLALLLGVLFLMGTHSAFFGPAKFGILPEMLQKPDLPNANGLVLMTTFVAIIFGQALAGYAKDWFEGRLWVISAMCIGIAFLGFLTSLFVRRTPIAHPGLELRKSSLLIDTDTWQMLRSDRPLMRVLLVSSLFWFLGGVVNIVANPLGRFVMGYSDSRTSMANACMGVGIAIGCMVAAKLSHRTVNFGLVRLGGWGLVGSLGAVAVLGWRASLVPLGERGGAESFLALLVPRQPFEVQLRLVMALVGVFAGLFVVPLQVFLQARPPEDKKGRMIGVMNLINWIGIVLSAGFHGALSAGMSAAGIGIEGVERNAHWEFAVLALLMLPIAAFYRPPSLDLKA